MEELKKIAKKGLLLLVLLALLNFVYERFLFRGDARAFSEAAHLLHMVQDSADILCLAESSDLTIADLDLEKRTTTQFLAQHYPRLRVLPLAKGALHAGNYYDLLRNIPGSSPVKTIVVTMNLRSFDASWIHSKLETALQKEMVLLKPGPPLWRRFMLSLRNYEIKTEKELAAAARAAWIQDTLRFPYPFAYPNVVEWDSAMSRGKVARAAGQPPLSKEETALACHYIKNFAFQIDPETNPRIRDFDRIAALAQKRGWNLVFNLLPENLEMAQQLVGEDLTFLMRQNRDLLVQRYGNQPNVLVIDQLETLSNEDFIDQNWTTEHYFEHGRRKVAYRLAQAIARWYPGQMQVPVNSIYLNVKSFSNDCEGGVVWNQMQTRDATRAHGGKWASLTGPEKGAFGITLAYPIQRLDTNRLDSFALDCWIFQTEGLHNAAIAWEVGGEKSGYHWDSLQFHGSLTKVGEWQELSLKIPVWPIAQQAEIIKVYPYNPSKTAIWFDDIRIEFLGAGK
jgi:hypothetical protein